MGIKWVHIGIVLRTKPGTRVFVKKICEESYKIEFLISPLLDKGRG